MPRASRALLASCTLRGTMITVPLNPPCKVIVQLMHSLQRQSTENSKKIFPEKKLRGLSPNSFIYVSVSDLYIPTIGLPILLQEFLFWEYINRNFLAMLFKETVEKDSLSRDLKLKKIKRFEEQIYST